MLPDSDTCSRALEARDVRFDGVFFVGIVTTGVYCRPICPARRTLRKNRRYFPSAASAERAGFRPCLRCRPELAPGCARIDAVPRLADAAASRIGAGALNGRGLDDLAAELGVGTRQLRRALVRELGVSPLELAQTRRLLLAKQLLTETSLPVTQVAFSSGFQSLRRFNAAFREHYRLNPTALRRRRSTSAATGVASSESRDETIQLTLSYRPPIAWRHLLAFLQLRAAEGTEHFDDATYARIVRVDGHVGVVTVSAGESAIEQREAQHTSGTLSIQVSDSLLPVLMQVSARVRHLFDLDADPNQIDDHLTRAGLRSRVTKLRGLRLPGAFDGFEVAIRAILGQQVTVKGASTLMSRLTSRFGERVETSHPGLTHLPATAERLADASLADLRALGILPARAEAIRYLAREVASGDMRIDEHADVDALHQQLTRLPGIGPWTADYIIMRAVHWPDAFPASDIVLRRAAGAASTADLLRRAERWRPWRAYAAMHLWASQ